MSRQFGRVAAVTLATNAQPTGIRVTGLRVKFKIERSTTKHPNKIEVEVFGLNEAHRNEFKDTTVGAQKVAAKLILEAGYTGNAQVVCTGDIRHISHVREAGEWKSTFQCGDGESAFVGGRTRLAFKAGTPTAEVMRAVAKDLGVGVGNLEERLAQLPITSLPGGYAAHGSAQREMDRLAHRLRLEWSIQNGELQLVEAGQPLSNQAFLLNAASGLIGSPRFGEADPKKGSFLKAKALLIPSLKPCGLVRIDSQTVTGNFRVEKITQNGDTHGNDWYSELELKRAS